MQPYFFPYLGYFQLINAVNKFILYGNVSFITKGWIHRNRVLLKNGRVMEIGLELVNKSPNRKIDEISIAVRADWKRRLIKTIAMNYAGSPRFAVVFPFIEEIIRSETVLVHDFNAAAIMKTAGYMGITTEIISDTAKYTAIEQGIEEFTGTAGSKGLDRKHKRVVDLCHLENAEIYINASGGRGLYSRSLFQEHGISLHFCNPVLPPYRQFNNPFTPSLSIIDVLMHCSAGQITDMLHASTID